MVVMKIQTILLYMLAFPLFLVTPACKKNTGAEDVQNNQGQTLKFMTYNIHIGNPPSQPSTVVDLDGIADAIKTVDPDFVALQEVDRFTDRSGKDLDQAKKLAELTGMNYQFFKAIDRSNGEYGVAILTKYPIIEHQQVLLPPLPGNQGETRTAGWIRVELSDGKDFVFASTHLDHLADENREYQSRELLKALKSYQKYPIVLGVDFNMNQSNSVWDL